MKGYKYIYGPVSSWRLGRSLGADPISAEEKVCTFDCLYCQIGGTKVFSRKRSIFVPTEALVEEIKSLPKLKVDYITFSGCGEPTLAKNLGEMIARVKGLRKEKVAVITNSSLIDEKDVQSDLGRADFVMAKLDAHSEELFQKINRPLPGITLERIVGGIKKFRLGYHGRLALQIMFIKENKDYAKEIGLLAREIAPNEVQISTPLRPCNVRPLSKEELDIIKGHFKAMNVVYVYGARKKKASAISKLDTLKRRGRHD